MNELTSALLDGVRVVLLRSPRGRRMATGPGAFIALIGFYLAAAFLIAAFDVDTPALFDPAGISTVLTDALLTLLAAWILIRLAGRDVLWGAAAILLAATTATAVFVHWPLAHAIAALVEHDQGLAALLLDLLSKLWWFLVLLVVANWLAPRHLGRVIVASVLAYAVSAAAWWWIPAPPLLIAVAAQADTGVESAPSATVDAGGTGSDGTATDPVNEAAATPDFDAEKLMYDQPALLQSAIDKLTPQTPGKIDVYVVAFAGDAEEDVFRNEADYVEELFDKRFDASGHVIVLENNAATITRRPLATWTNLHRALDAIARKMDPEQDILFVYLTSHGSSDHQLLVDLDPLPLNQIGPDDLADALKTTPRIRWKVVVVNACYSGGFVDALRDDSTMVIASAREDRTSFGCGADSDITYFGKAFLTEALNRTTSLREAFDIAKTSVGKWEAADKEEPSEPQIASSRSIEAKLEAWQRTLRESPAVPFAPASDTPPDAPDD